MAKKMTKIMVTGSAGQIGTELIKALRKKYDALSVLATDIQAPEGTNPPESGPFEFLDVTKRDKIEAIVQKYNIDTIFHMAAILSATGEKKPHLAWDVNMTGTHNILETAREHRMTRVFIPSSIAVFGPETPRDRTPQETILKPKTMYGVTKVAGELLGNYYAEHFGLDVRGCRFPGIISHEALPGGGTTDYAVAIFYEAVKYKKYTCFLKKDTRLPMMYMPDCLKAIFDLMEANPSRLEHHADFNVAAMSFTPGELAAEIKNHIPEFVCDYKPDFRQAIAETWPMTIDDTAAKKEWRWRPDYDLAAMTKDMLSVLSVRWAEGRLNY